jgi:hypothetical protein
MGLPVGQPLRLPWAVMAVPGHDPGIDPAIHAPNARKTVRHRQAGANEAFHHRSFARRHFRLAAPVDGRVNPRIVSGDCHDGFPLSVH